MKYTVQPRSKWGFFTKSKIVFDLHEKYEYWHDSSYGNGGGDWIPSTRVLHTYEAMIDAMNAMNKLNELDRLNKGEVAK